jgi:N4-gp56 family major capsid protein
VAEWVYQSSDTLTNQRWAKLMLTQYMADVLFFRFASRDESSLVLIMDDLQKHAGDRVTFGISQLLQGPGVIDLNALTGSEETPITYGDTLYIHELAHAILLVGPISDQRILFDRRKTGRSRLSDWYAARTDHSGANQLAGYTPQTDTRFTGLQSTVATTRQVLPAGITDAANLTSANTFDITVIDTATNNAKAITSGIRAMRVGGRDFYIMFQHTAQATDMRKNTSLGQWLDIQKAAMTGGDIGDNPIFWMALGMYRQTLIHENIRVTNAVANAGTAVANTKRALHCGAQAAVLAFGRSHNDSNKFRWLEELRDFGRQIGIGVSAIWGLLKVNFNSTDFAVQALDTYGIDIDTLGATTTLAQ